MFFMRGGQKVVKGMKMTLDENGVSTVGMKADRMRAILHEHADFKNEKNMIEHLLWSCSMLSIQVSS